MKKEELIITLEGARKTTSLKIIEDALKLHRWELISIEYKKPRKEVALFSRELR